MDRGAWWTTVHRVTKSWTQLSMHTQITISLSSTISSRKPHSRRDNSVHRLLTRYGWGFRLSLSLTWSFPCGSVGKESTCNVGHLGSIPGSGRSPGEGNSYPLQYSFLENSMDRGLCRAIVHGIAKSQTKHLSLHRGCKVPMPKYSHILSYLL